MEQPPAICVEFDGYLPGRRKEADENGSFFEGIAAFEDMKEKYNIVKFLIWHIENDPALSKERELSLMIKEKEILPEAVWSIAKHCAVDKEKCV